ncbi:MAG: hypothetical protein GVY28_12475, partial [Alphaproteobacteria bacterium]|nr:hypothetical protein [Alphaproteobacteria bacterium]
MSRSSLFHRHRPVAAFIGEEDGSLLIWNLFTVIAIMLAVGLGLSVQMFELHRASLQNTLDRAVLAATDLDQTREAKAVITDYVTRAGFEGSLTSAEVETGVNFRTSSAAAELTMQTIAVPGDPTWNVGASSAAIESITDIEIALVLDNSGSMGWDKDSSSGDGNYRLNLLKPAAKDFVDAVSRPKNSNLPGSVSVSIVPFSTQVSAGPDIAAELDFTNEHSYSHCARFAADDYGTTAFSPTETVQRAGHFDVFTW